MVNAPLAQAACAHDKTKRETFVPQPRWRLRLFHLLLLVRRPMTLGVRILVTGEKDTVLLVRHTYVSGWHLPGGGIEKGETAKQAAEKELLEETGIMVGSELEPLAVFANRRASKRDHVVLFLCRDWQTHRAFVPNREIAEIGFFPLNALPSGTTQPTRSRIKEALVTGNKSQPTTTTPRFPEFW